MNSCLIDRLIDLFTMHDCFAIFHDMYIIILCLFTNLISMIARCCLLPMYAFTHSDHSLYIF